MENLHPRFVAAFVRSVAVLALDASAEVAYLGDVVNDPVSLVDELALEFDDGFRLVPTFIDRGWLKAAALPALAELDEQLGAMSGQHNAHLWEADALTARAEWDRVRALARAALAVLA